MKFLFTFFFVALISAQQLFAKPDEADTRIVSVVYGVEAIPRPADRGYAFNRARSLDRHLNRAGVSSKMFSDAQLKEALAPPCRVAHLVYFDAPTPAQMQLIRAFADGGGKLVVHYSSSEPLAKLMGVKIEGIKKSEDTERWEGIRFVAKKPLNAPDFTDNPARQVLEVVPADSATAAVIARWTAAGNKAKPVACVRGANGLWLTQILTDEGSGEKIRTLVAALSADGCPQVWRYAAKRLYRDTWQSLHAKSFADAQKRLKPKVPGAKVAQFNAVMKKAASLYVEIETDFASGLFGKATPKIWALAAHMQSAYALAHPAPNAEVRTIWDRNGNGIVDGDWAKTAVVLKDAGITDVYILAAAPGWAIAPENLAAAIKACRPRGIRVHAWITAMTAERMSEADFAQLAKRELALFGTDGKPMRWLNPAEPENRREVARIAARLVAESGVDGIHLDYIRYPTAAMKLSEKDRARFKTWYGKPVELPASVLNAPKKVVEKYHEWRALQMTETVKVIRDEVKRANKNVVFTTAVYGSHPKCVASVGQDWRAWLKADLVDYVVPMNYSPDLATYKELLDEQSDYDKKARMVSGIGVTSFEALLSSNEVIDQIQETAKYKTKGFALYQLDKRCLLEILPMLKLTR